MRCSHCANGGALCDERHSENCADTNSVIISDSSGCSSTISKSKKTSTSLISGPFSFGLTYDAFDLTFYVLFNNVFMILLHFVRSAALCELPADDVEIQILDQCLMVGLSSNAWPK